MMTMVNSRLLTVDDLWWGMDFPHVWTTSWSRPYEYCIASKLARSLDQNRWDSRGVIVHNASCGAWGTNMPWGEHKLLYRAWWYVLDANAYTLLLSDIHERDGNEPDSYRYWNILEPWPGAKADFTFCISTLEHLPKREREVAIENLGGATKHEGFVIVTEDVPKPEGVEQEVLTGATSAWPDERYADTAVRLSVWRVS